MGKQLLKSALYLFLSAIVGFVLVLIGYCIPRDWFSKNLSQSFIQMSGEETYPKEPISQRQLDNWTDSLTLLECAYDGSEGALSKAINIPYVTDGQEPHATLVHLVSDPQAETGIINYGRYWHGNLLIDRLLLCVLNYYQIRILLGIILFILSAAIIWLMYKKARNCIIPFVLSMLIIGPTAVANSMMFSWPVFITLIPMIIILWKTEWICRGNRAHMLFLFVGIAIVCFEYLDFPLLTLVFPLTLLCILEKEKCAKFRYVAGCVLFWLIGYAGMWAAKWIIGIIYKGPEFFQEIISVMGFRTGITWEGMSFVRTRTLFKNILQLIKVIYVDVAVLTYMIGNLVKYRRNISLSSFKDGAIRLKSLIVPVLIPAFWILVMSNHSFVHYWFTYRILVPCVFGFLAWLNYSLRKDDTPALI